MSYETIECKDRDTWLQTRRQGIGASEAAAVCNASTRYSPSDIWGFKVGLLEEDAAELREEMEWGLLLEDDVAEKYSRETERLVIIPKPYTISRSTKYPWMQATLDAEIAPIDDRGPGLLQIKTAGFMKKEDWSDEPPLHYLIQVQHELAVQGYQWGTLVVLFGGARFHMLWTDITRNDQFIEALIEKEQAFWELVTTETPPPLEGESGIELLKRLFPKHEPGKVIELPLEAVDWHQDLVAVKEELKILKDKENELKNRFAAVLKDAERGVLPSGDSYLYKLIEKKEYTVKPQSYRELRFVPSKERR
jgi:putative phage-type endonuclease